MRQNRLMSRFASLLLCFPALCQTPLTINDVARQSAERYPAIRVSSEQVSAAAAAVNLARTAFLPRVDFHTQLNRATRNNVYGLLLPQQVIPPISGPPNPNNSMTNVWGSAVGLLVSWEPFDFGLRQAQVDAASASKKHWEASVERTRFDVTASAVDGFLTVVAAEQTVATANASVKRAQVFSDIVNALVKAELRPGAEASRARAELASAQLQVAQAEQAVAVAKASLTQYLGGSAAAIQVDAGKLLESPGGLESATAANEAHPLLREQSTVVDESKARQRILDRSYFPKFSVQGASYARGTGAHPDFTTGGAAAGLGPNIYNWATGISMTMPLMDFASLREKKAVEAAQARSETARYDQIKQDLQSRIERAKAMLDGARKIAAIIPAQMEAARVTEQQATARYRAGLGTMVEVAEAQRLLTQTEIDHSIAKLNIWRALLAVSAAQGDLAPFLEQAGRK